MPQREAKEHASARLAQLGLAARLGHTPAELSGGERQRTAIARALVNNPKLVLLDEPTGNLDEHTAAQVEKAMLELIEHSATAFVLVTHDLALASRMSRCLLLKSKGCIRFLNVFFLPRIGYACFLSSFRVCCGVGYVNPDRALCGFFLGVLLALLLIKERGAGRCYCCF